MLSLVLLLAQFTIPIQVRPSTPPGTAAEQLQVVHDVTTAIVKRLEQPPQPSSSPIEWKIVTSPGGLPWMVSVQVKEVGESLDHHHPWMILGTAHYDIKETVGISNVQFMGLGDTELEAIDAVIAQITPWVVSRQPASK